jgi:serine/threonine-protein kinase
MGEVYRARDTRLSRDVALKILPEAFADDAERLLRFRREAQLLAALNHPSIGAIYGLEEGAHGHALVLELVEGPTLADRIAQGPLPLDEALPLARQMAEALEAAHGQGIIHRDLKPANVKLRPDGTVKVLDFGLAKSADAPPPEADVSQSPTTSRPILTGGAVLLGTPAYMSPEQAKGLAADKRSDVWAFGCVLFEMLTAQCPFRGEDVAETLAFVLTKPPDWGALPPAAPPSIRRLLRRCLEKNRGRRLADMADARLEIDEALAAPAATDAPPPQTRSAVRRALPWVIAALMGAALIGMLARRGPRAVPPAAGPMRMSIDLGGEAPLAPLPALSLGLSPAGNVIVYTAPKPEGSLLYVRRLDQLAASPLQGTDGAWAPFFSPDGQWIAFFADGKLKKIPAAGGAVVTLADAPAQRGAFWAEDDTIVMAPDVSTGLVRVPAAGGRRDVLTTLDPGEATQRWPQLLPGGRALLYTSHTTTSGFDAATLVVRTLPDGPRKVVVEGAYSGRYLRSGHLLFVREATLFAAPFDIDRLEVGGPAVPVIQGVLTSTLSGFARFDASDEGTLVYVPGDDVAANPTPIRWLDRSGKTAPMRATAQISSNIDFSPDGRRLALDIYDGRQWDIWIYDWARDTPSRLTFEASNQWPVWAPDGRRIVFNSSHGHPSVHNLYWLRSDGTGEVQRLTESDNFQNPGSWHPSGKLLAFIERHPQTGRDLWILPLDGDEASGWRPGKPYLFLASAFEELGPSFSPDGRWLAYHSNESGRYEAYVRPFPGPGGKYLISTAGGSYPVWAQDRQELFYYASDKRLMVSTYAGQGEAFSAERPRPWAETRLQLPSDIWYRFRRFALHPDGRRFAYLAPPEGVVDGGDHVTLVLNFFEELRRLAPSPQR